MLVLALVAPSREYGVAFYSPSATRLVLETPQHQAVLLRVAHWQLNCKPDLAVYTEPLPLLNKRHTQEALTVSTNVVDSSWLFKQQVLPRNFVARRIVVHVCVVCTAFRIAGY